MFQIIFLTFVTQAFAQSQFSQGHLKYSDPSGTKVDWKLYAPYSQFKAQLHNYQRRDGSKSLMVPSQMSQPAKTIPVEVGVKSTEPSYKPFSQVPHHLKQLLKQSYEPEGPYVNPDAFFHKIPPFSFGEVIPSKAQPMEDQSTIIRLRAQQYRQEKPKFGEKHLEEEEERIDDQKSQPQVPVMSFSFDKSVPLQIQQLLHYQAQIPYNVIANHIVYKPETPFVPEPLPEDEVGTYKYRSKVYYAVNRDTKLDKVREHVVTENRN